MDYSERIVNAFTLAHQLHRAQKRKGSGVSYLCHLTGVASLVMEYDGTEDEVAAAFLHDAVEDQGGDEAFGRIHGVLGDAVACIVRACTDAHGHPKPPWKERKLAHIALMATAIPSARLVMCADKINNARAMVRDLAHAGDSLWDRFRAGREGMLWYLRECQAALSTNWEHPILVEFEEVLVLLEERAGLTPPCAGGQE